MGQDFRKGLIEWASKAAVPRGWRWGLWEGVLGDWGGGSGEAGEGVLAAGEGAWAAGGWSGSLFMWSQDCSAWPSMWATGLLRAWRH